jgi:dihydrofolate reductase
MRKLVVTEFMSLDGVMENPAWTFKYGHDEIEKYKLDELLASDALLLGRVTYEAFASAWPSAKDEQGFADRMNTMSKYVVSSTLKTAVWNNSSLIKGDVVAEITRLKYTFGENILVGGSCTLVQTLIQHHLVDHYTLLVYPLVLGTGKRLFQAGTKANLKLIETRTFPTGVTALVYQPDNSQ